MYPNNAEVQDLLKSFKHENNVKTNCVSFDTKPVKEAKVIMDRLMEVSDTGEFEDNKLEIDLEIGRKVEYLPEISSTEDNPTNQFYFK